jgi:hypothetical protein
MRRVTRPPAQARRELAITTIKRRADISASPSNPAPAGFSMNAFEQLRLPGSVGTISGSLSERLPWLTTADRSTRGVDRASLAWVSFDGFGWGLYPSYLCTSIAKNIRAPTIIRAAIDPAQAAHFSDV